MIYSFNIGATLTRELDESELDSLVADLWSVKTVARQSGKVFNLPNYIYNIYNETDFNEVSQKFGGTIRIYFETEIHDVAAEIQTIAMLLSKHEVEITQIVRKFKVNAF